MELKDLVGLHWLSGVKRMRLEDPGPRGRECRCGAWIELDEKCYCVTWEEAHGRTIVDLPIHESPTPFQGDRFPPLQVVGSMGDSIQTRMLYFLDVINGSRILAIGHDSFANFHFMVDFNPELASKNLTIPDGQNSPRYPGNWVIAEYPSTTGADGDAGFRYAAEVYEAPDGRLMVRLEMDRTGRRHVAHLDRSDWEKLGTRCRTRLVGEIWANLEGE